jgi:hypothetical protein
MPVAGAGRNYDVALRKGIRSAAGVDHVDSPRGLRAHLSSGDLETGAVHRDERAEHAAARLGLAEAVADPIDASEETTGSEAAFGGRHMLS